MFATVEFYEIKTVERLRLRNIFSGGRIITERINLPENEYFYKLKVPVNKGRIPYEKLRRLSENIKDGLIFPEGFRCEKDIKVFYSSYFEILVLFNSAIRLLKNNISEPSETVLTLVDKRGVLSQYIKRLIPFAAEIRIITENINAYERVREALMDEYGLSLFVSNKLSAISKKGIIISPESRCIPLSFNGLLITSEKRFLPFARVFMGEGIKCPSEFRKICPEGIKPEVFLAALCESCFVSQLRNAEFEKLVDISSSGI